MLIELLPHGMNIKKDSLIESEYPTLTQVMDEFYCEDIHITLKEIKLKGHPSRMYDVLLKIAKHHDIEIM